MRYPFEKRWFLPLALLAVLLLSAFTAAPEAPSGGASRYIVLWEDGTSPADMEEAIGRTEGAELLWRYDALLSGAAVDAGAAAAEALRALPGVTEVRPVRTYESPLASAGEGNGVPSTEGLALMGADKLWEEGYTGDGVVIAVLDTGLRTGHEAFADSSLLTAPALSRADVEAFAAKGGTAGTYVSQRIPFAYDYYGRDGEVDTSNGHGTHVTALAAGFARNQDGSVRFRGGAPGAQILSLKIFPDGSSGSTDDAVILRALEDAWNLGADVVNISVGTGAGFVQDETLDGLFCKAFQQMADDGVVLCCAAGNESSASAEKPWMPKQPTAAYTDYGANCAPSSYRGAVAVGAAARTASGRAEAAEYSSWGPATQLHLTPALLAFGGPVLSANASGEDLYRSDSGTSMASPAAAGLFASLLQVLRERGVTDRAEAARLAQGLLESTAQILEDGGVPISPRKQGAGLVDLSAAATSGLVILDPLVELGDSLEGTFTLTLTLRNLTASPVTASLDATVLTDAYEKRGDAYFSALAARDITSGVTVEGARSVTVPANGEAKAALTLTVGESLRRELEPVFTNGFYVEGYVAATGGGNSAHAAFLGYCGDWGAAPVLEPLDFRDVQDVWFRMAEKAAPSGGDLEKPGRYLPELRADLGANLAFLAPDNSDRPEDGRLLGVNPHAYALHDDARFAMPSQDTNAAATQGSRLCLDVYTLRNAAGIALVISDQETGAVYHAESETWWERSIIDGYSKEVAPAISFSWLGTDASNKPLSGGTRVRVDVYAWQDTDKAVTAAYNQHVRRDKPEEYGWLLEEAYAPYRELSFPLVLDGRAPTVSAAASGDRLTLTFRDDQYLAYALVCGRGRTKLEEEVFFPKAAGESGTVAVSFPGGAYPEELYIRVEDYAGNTACYSLDGKALASGGSVAPEPCAMFLLEDVDLGAWYHEAVDAVLERGIMEADENVRFRPGESATRAEIVRALHQANGAPASRLTADALPFRDVSQRSSYAAAVCWAYENGLVAGETATTFAGTSQVSRQQLAVMLWRCAKLKGALGGSTGNLAPFPDRGGVAGWAQEAMAWAVGQGIINGQDGRLNPAGPVTRAQAAQMLMRFLAR